MARSKWKMLPVNKRILKFLFLTKFSRKKFILKFFDHSMKIPKTFHKNWILLYKGLNWTKFKISKFHLGKNLGEFSLTRKPFYFPLKEVTQVKLIKR